MNKWVYWRPGGLLAVRSGFLLAAGEYTEDLLVARQVYWWPGGFIGGQARFTDGQMGLLAVRRGILAVRWGLIATRRVY
jgi:hypothetical protein